MPGMPGVPEYPRPVFPDQLAQAAGVVHMVMSDQDIAEMEAVGVEEFDDRGGVARVDDTGAAAVAADDSPDVVVPKRGERVDMRNHEPAFLSRPQHVIDSKNDYKLP